MRFSNSFMPWRSNVRFRLLTLSHQTMVWMPDRRAVAEDVAEELGRRDRLVLVVARVAEVVVRLAEVAEPLDVVDEDVDRAPDRRTSTPGGA